MLSTVLALITYLSLRVLLPMVLLIGVGEWVRRRGDSLRSMHSSHSGD